MEREDEIAGLGNSYTAMFWQYDSRTARRWNQDPRPNPSISRYGTFALNPVLFSDAMGDTNFVYGADRQDFVDNIDTRSENLTLGLEDNQMTYSINEGAILEPWEQEIVNSINDETVNVNIIADSNMDFAYNDLNEENVVLLGMYAGYLANVITDKRNAFQFIDEEGIRTATNCFIIGVGVVEIHELLEAYAGAKYYTGPREKNEEGVSKEYDYAHKYALWLFPEAGNISLYTTGAQGGFNNKPVGTWTYSVFDNTPYNYNSTAIKTINFDIIDPLADHNAKEKFKIWMDILDNTER